MSSHAEERDSLWAHHHAEWRDPAQIAALWDAGDAVDPELLRHRVRGPWWDLLDRLDVTLLVTREYEHLVLALTVVDGSPRVSYMRVPHPSGLAIDRARGRVHLASTRNPNQLIELAPAVGAQARRDVPPPDVSGFPLLPLRSTFHPGSLYIHDLALIDGELHANAVGENAVVRFASDGRAERVWWPRAIERDGEPDFSRNYLQVNSIAAGETVQASYFSASAEAMSARRPGHLNFPVDGRGVIFSGATREPIVRGLTRPHSARLHRGATWVDNSGYGEVGVAHDGRFEPLARLSSWTRGLGFCDDVAFVGISRVIPRFHRYAPGLDVERSACGIVAIDVGSGAEIARITWPLGNQIFAVDWMSRGVSHGFPFTVARRRVDHTKRLFYSFTATTSEE